MIIVSNVFKGQNNCTLMYTIIFCSKKKRKKKKKSSKDVLNPAKK